ncbi:MAG: glycosyltransferase [Bacteroidetes bacterium]|nr:glycosyltransferase [Bacteroidota bacterium]
MDSERKLHIVSFDNPWPPDYGGAIDVFYRIRQLYLEGISITLHAFEYGRKDTGETEKYCSRIFFYKRNRMVNPFSPKPYIVASRISGELTANLLKDNAPILFEGLHTCGILAHPAFTQRKKLVRMHNVEHEYYRSLALSERNLFRKAWFHAESFKLKGFNNILKHADTVIAISSSDYAKLSAVNPDTCVAGPFHSSSEPADRKGCGEFALYHGKLSVPENDRAARFIVSEVAPLTGFPIVIAGSSPGARLRHAIKVCQGVSLVENPGIAELDELISLAHINLLPAFQETGVKLKLINSLFRGRHVIANRMMINGTGCEVLCHIAGTASEFARNIDRLARIEFTDIDIQQRKPLIQGLFDNKTNAAAIIEKAGI